VRVSGRGTSSDHLPAFVRAATACLGASLAVLGRVPGTFMGAGVTGLRTGPADRSGDGGVPAHVAGTDPAQFGAVAACSHAVRHTRMIDARVAAVLARLGAFDAGVDATSELLVCHEISLHSEQVQRSGPNWSCLGSTIPCPSSAHSPGAGEPGSVLAAGSYGRDGPGSGSGSRVSGAGWRALGSSRPLPGDGSSCGGSLDDGTLTSQSSLISTPCVFAAFLIRFLIVATSSRAYLAALSEWLM